MKKIRLFLFSFSFLLIGCATGYHSKETDEKTLNQSALGFSQGYKLYGKNDLYPDFSIKATWRDNPYEILEVLSVDVKSAHVINFDNAPKLDTLDIAPRITNLKWRCVSKKPLKIRYSFDANVAGLNYSIRGKETLDINPNGMYHNRKHSWSKVTRK